MILRLALCAGVICGAVGAAQTDPATAAIEQLETAHQSLRAAEASPDPVQALTRTIHAYEAGLDAMGDGLRIAAAREAQLNQALALRETEIARFLMVLQAAEAAPPAVALMHPAGPDGAARAQIMMAEMKPALQQQAEELRIALDEVRILQAAQAQAATVLQKALPGAEQARSALSDAIAARTELPTRFREDPVRTAILISSVETLDEFTSGLSQISAQPIALSTGDVSDRKGALDLPVQGNVQGPSGAGITVTTRPRALVTSPTAATIRYRGPLLDMGNVVILEPQPDLLLLFAGLEDAFGRIGDVIPAGTPVGFMGGNTPEIGTILSLSGDGTGAHQSEALYMEVREGGRPVDPATWFRTDKDG
ncbi:murein hydrolase activator EnvC family protein [Sedimentitalea todarodis]|uniref:Peptidoglycan DD-metalloendopeptidase family protein n=1 Tax=Sedimentitalea todarodis TaxID=1631240 RepID=A0ABU3V9W6_9RHOB|nr:peptidoglycan DD-metalloendopeptidase family protein [Sedimentitalea todarodis]MDU9002961.1 peptidoglycan DD-metalloendopeptidase family protein [Sedimentitalea todarodis]